MLTIKDNVKALYKISKDNLYKTGGDSLPFSLELITMFAEGKLDVFDVTGTSDLNDREFVIAAYYGLLGSYPDEKTIDIWHKEAEKENDKNAFRKHVICTILQTEEAKCTMRVPCNLPAAISLPDKELHGTFLRLKKRLRRTFPRLFG